MVGEKAFEIDEIFAVIRLFKAHGFDKSLGLLIGNRADEGCAMYTAEVDKIERSSAEDEKSLEIERAVCGGEVVNNSALIGELELADAHKDVVYGCAVSEQIGLEFNVTFFADILLLCLALNGENFKHFYFLSDNLLHFR